MYMYMHMCMYMCMHMYIRLYFEDPAHELFGFISGLEGLDEDSGWLGA